MPNIATIEVVVNRCYGGYGLSSKAVAELLRRNHPVAKEIMAKLSSTGLTLAAIYQIAQEIPRHDPILVAVVKDLGDEANGEHAKLEIREIALGYEVEDIHDGIEEVVR